MSVENINSEARFNEVLAQNPHVLVDFWAPWCGPCKAMSPTFEYVANEKTQLKAIKVNIDDFPNIAQKHGIRSIPSLLLVEESLVRSEHVGLASKQEVLHWLNNH